MISGTTGARGRPGRIVPVTACSARPVTVLRMANTCGSGLAYRPPVATVSDHDQGRERREVPAVLEAHLDQVADRTLPQQLRQPDHARVVAVGRGQRVLDPRPRRGLVEALRLGRVGRQRLVAVDVAPLGRRQLDRPRPQRRRRRQGEHVRADGLHRPPPVRGRLRHPQPVGRGAHGLRPAGAQRHHLHPQCRSASVCPSPANPAPITTARSVSPIGAMIARAGGGDIARTRHPRPRAEMTSSRPTLLLEPGGLGGAPRPDPQLGDSAASSPTPRPPPGSASAPPALPRGAAGRPSGHRPRGSRARAP